MQQEQQRQQQQQQQPQQQAAPREQPEYKAAIELELWKEQQEQAFTKLVMFYFVIPNQRILCIARYRR